MKNFSQLVALGVVSMGLPGPNYGGPARRFLKVFTLGAKTTLLGKSFHHFTTLIAKEFLRSMQ